MAKSYAMEAAKAPDILSSGKAILEGCQHYADAFGDVIRDADPHDYCLIAGVMEHCATLLRSQTNPKLQAVTDEALKLVSPAIITKEIRRKENPT